MKSEEEIRQVIDMAYRLSSSNENVCAALDNLIEIVESEQPLSSENDGNAVGAASFSDYIITVGGYVAILGILASVVMFAGMRFAGHW